MRDKLSFLIRLSFSIIFFTIPLIFTTVNSELFEFNKIIVLYFGTLLVCALWAARMIWEKRIIFKPTYLDIPILILLVSQLASTIFSIDIHTSIWGYYGRFNGGLVSSICYALLFWGYTSNVHKNDKPLPLYFLLVSAFLVSLYALAQHYGIDDHIWVQDVKNRVFSTLGQPNWLASFLSALFWIPLGFALNTSHQKKESSRYRNLLFWVYTISSLSFFIAILFTKSRSGLIGLGVSALVFIFFCFRKTEIKINMSGAVAAALFIVAIIYFGTPWTPSVGKLISGNSSIILEEKVPSNLVISESTDIRKVVWKGAVSLWKQKPILGTGPETFAFSYPWVRPVEHNVLSEWDYVYNKAHNQYLHIAATTGTLGIVSYVLLLISILFMFFKHKLNNSLDIALFSGWISLLITNLVGFSVVPTDLLLFIIPAIVITEEDKLSQQEKKRPISKKQISGFFLITTIFIFFSFKIASYWLGDYYYAKALKQNDDAQQLSKAFTNIKKATEYNSGEPVYIDQLSIIASEIAVNTNDQLTTQGMKDLSLEYSQKLNDSFPYNLSFKKSRARVLFTLSSLDPILLDEAIDTVEDIIKLSPTDPKLYYNLALLQARSNQTGNAIESLTKAIKLKPNYEDSFLALALIYEEKSDLTQAQANYKKLLEINPDHPIARERLN
jgi:putative inorganic carbon (hco3(-)) transporter